MSLVGRLLSLNVSDPSPTASRATPDTGRAADGGGRRPRALAVAFECEPNAGSEAGAGWGMVKSLAEVADVTVLVGTEHVDAIHEWMAIHPDERLTFVPVQTNESDWLKRLIRLHRQFDFVKYLAWLRGAGPAGRALAAEQDFDVAVHVAYGSYWLPSPVVTFGVPSVWGPVGGATVTPWKLMPLLGWKAFVAELEGRAVIRFGSWLPSTRRTWRQATIRLCETPQTRDALPEELRADTRIINRAILSRIPATPTLDRTSYVVFPSSLQGRKGPRLAVRALAYTPPSVSLRFVSNGYEEARLRRLAEKLGVADRVEFLGRVPRDDMFKMLAEASAVIFAGLREEGGCALSEAMLMGAPVVVLGHAGPRVIAEHNTDPERVAIVAPSTPRRTAREMGAAITRFCASPSTATGSYLAQDAVEKELSQALLDAIKIGV